MTGCSIIVTCRRKGRGRAGSRTSHPARGCPCPSLRDRRDADPIRRRGRRRRHPRRRLPDDGGGERPARHRREGDPRPRARPQGRARPDRAMHPPRLHLHVALRPHRRGRRPRGGRCLHQGRHGPRSPRTPSRRKRRAKKTARQVEKVRIEPHDRYHALDRHAAHLGHVEVDGVPPPRPHGRPAGRDRRARLGTAGRAAGAAGVEATHGGSPRNRRRCGRTRQMGVRKSRSRGMWGGRRRGRCPEVGRPHGSTTPIRRLTGHVLPPACRHGAPPERREASQRPGIVTGHPSPRFERLDVDLVPRHRRRAHGPTTRRIGGVDAIRDAPS